jgi:hypothetical protein
MFASNFNVLDTHLAHVRGQSNLKTLAQKHSVLNGKTMTNYFCDTYGTLMYRVGERFPGVRILRLGTVDDFSLVEGKMRPQYKQFVRSRAGWLDGPKGDVERFDEAAL